MKNNKIKYLTFVLMAMLVIPCLLFSACKNNEVAKVSTGEELINALKGDKSTIQLEADIDLGQSVYVNRKVTLNLNGKTISNTTDIWNDTDKHWSLVGVGKDGDLTITGNGKLLAKENDCYCFDVRGGGKLTIENGEFVGNISTIYAFEGNVELRGGTYSIKQKSSSFGSRLEINLYDQNRQNNTANIKIYGGRYIDFDPGDPMEEGYKLLADGYISKLVEGSQSEYVVTKA